MYPKIITEEIIRLQASGFTIKETQEYLHEHYQIQPHRNTVHIHRHSPIGQEMLFELIRHQQRSILKADSSDPALAMKYRSDLIGKIADKIMPDLVYSKHESDVNITERKITQIDNLNADERRLLDTVARKYIKSTHTSESASLH